IRFRRRIVLLFLLLIAIVFTVAVVRGDAGAAVMLAGLAMIILAIYPWLLGEIERWPLDEAVRADCGTENFVRLRHGHTHFNCAGPEDGQKVVFVTGLASSCFIWDYQFQALADAGFRVLRYDN